MARRVRGGGGAPARQNRGGKPLRKVAVIGAGTTPFRSRWPDKTFFELAFEAGKAAMEDAGIGKDDVQSAVYGVYNELFERQMMPEIFVSEYLGLTLIPATRVAAGGATGGAAVRSGFLEVASGVHDVVLVLGVEKALDCFNYEVGKSTPEVLNSIAYSIDMTYEYPLGAFAAAEYALPTVAHMERYGTTERQMALVSVKNHGNAVGNPIAQSPMKITVEDVLKSPQICYPFKLLDNCLYSEGASALILASEDVARELTDDPVWVSGVGMALDRAFPGFKTEAGPSKPWEFGSTRVACQRAYEMAGIKDPRRELDLIEFHDAFTSAEILSYEAAGLCPEGEGGRLLEEGVVFPDGDLPTCPSGGLIGCGHAVGATGVMQTAEALNQLRGRMGKRQLKKARRAMIQSIGGVACAFTVMIILEREDR